MSGYSRNAELEPKKHFHSRKEAMCGGSLHKGSRILTVEGKQVLDDENFRSRDFWEGYKLYCFGRYSSYERSKALFLASKMGRVVRRLQQVKQVPWGIRYDENVREAWAMMEDYAESVRGQDWKNLRPLMEKFDDVKELSSSENGLLLMQLVEEDECNIARKHVRSAVVEVKCTDLCDDIRDRLKRLHSDLEMLKKSVGADRHSAREVSGKRPRIGKEENRNLSK